MFPYKSNWKRDKEKDLLEDKVGVLNVIASIFLSIVIIWLLLQTLTPPQI